LPLTVLHLAVAVAAEATIAMPCYVWEGSLPVSSAAVSLADQRSKANREDEQHERLNRVFHFTLPSFLPPSTSPAPLLPRFWIFLRWMAAVGAVATIRPPPPPAEQKCTATLKRMNLPPKTGR